MRLRWLYGGLLVLVVGLSGCGKTDVDPASVVDETTRLGESIDINLSNWLGEPREKLAQLARETHDRVLGLLKDTRSDVDSVALLPQLRVPLTVPVLRQAEYSKKLGISLPTYLKEGQHDSLLALHLARHGDVEAGLKLADPADNQITQQIEACRGDRNYPVEWTRLVALALQEAQLKMAMGEVEGATELVLLHRQLRTLLDPRTAAGPLGAALLPIGQRSLKDAVVEWRESANKKPAVAEEIETTLKDWGEAPAPQPTYAPGASRSALAAVFQEINEGRMLAAKSPAYLLRVLDLLNVPVVGERLDGVVAWFNDKDQLAEFWFLYGSHVGELFPEPIHLAHHLVEHGLASKEVDKAAGLTHQSYSKGKLVFDVRRMERSPALGAVVRVAEAGAAELPAALPKDPRDFGLLHLARTFEQTRVELAPEQAPAKTLTLENQELLAQFNDPMSKLHAAKAVVERVGDHNLIGGLELHWATEEKLNLVALPKLLLPLWGAYGPSRFESINNNLALIWDQDPLRLTLLLPYNDPEPPVFTIRDLRGNKDAGERLKEAVALDLERRKARWEETKPLTRLPRYVQWAELTLGLPRQEALKALPYGFKSRPAIKTADGSISVLFNSNAPRTATYYPLQLVLRFGADDKLAEVRLRYQEGPAKPTADSPSLLDVLKKAGVPEVLPAPWLGLWADYSPVKPAPVYFRWSDDRTYLTYQRDNGCIEVVLHDCPLAYAQGIPLKPFEVCTRGPQGCQLGDSREELLKRWKISTPTTTPDGGLVLPQSEKSSFDLAVVYFEDNKAVRILAQHKIRPAAGNEDYTGDLQKVWLSDLDRLGVVRRIDKVVRPETGDLATTGFTWNDDLTRVHALVQQRPSGARLFTEWRDWPVNVSRTVSAKP